MSRYGTDWAVKERAALIQRLGGKCVKCGIKKRLEVDHINGKQWVAFRVASDTRVRRYLREEKEGLLQVLCKFCNSCKYP